jgi:tetratricopeptide (TPR) repeat protein
MAFYQNDKPEMSRQVTAATGKQGTEDLLLALDADTAAYFGRLSKARELSRLAANSARRSGDNESAATYDAVAALREGLFGNMDRVAQITKSGLGDGLSGGRDNQYAGLLARTFAGQRAQQLASEFSKSFPKDTVAQFTCVPTLRAKMALNDSKAQQALDQLDAAAPYELGLAALGFYNWPNLYPAYVRGEAYLGLDRGAEAAAEFQKILDHGGVVLNEPIGALAHLQLGRAYAMQGDTVKARAAYQDFFALWKDADPDIPILKQAKAEYAKLQ